MNQQAQDFEKELKQELQKIELSTALPPEWIRQALTHESCSSLGCSLETLKNILSGSTNAYSLSFLVSALQSKTPLQMEMSVEEWIVLQERVSVVAFEWNEKVEPIKTKLMRKMQANQRIQRAVPPQKIIGNA